MEQDELNRTLLAAGMAAQICCVQECAGSHFWIGLGLGQRQRALFKQPSHRKVFARRVEHVAFAEQCEHVNSAYRA